MPDKDNFNAVVEETVVRRLTPLECERLQGFPLAYERAGAEAVWASEIEEFCIAVTKKRFGEGREDDAETESQDQFTP